MTRQFESRCVRCCAISSQHRRAICRGLFNIDLSQEWNGALPRASFRGRCFSARGIDLTPRLVGGDPPDSAIAPVSQVLTLTGGGRPMIRGISEGYRAMLRILVLAILIPIAVVIAVAIFGAFFWSAG